MLLITGFASSKRGNRDNPFCARENTRHLCLDNSVRDWWCGITCMDRQFVSIVLMFWRQNRFSRTRLYYIEYSTLPRWRDYFSSSIGRSRILGSFAVVLVPCRPAAKGWAKTTYHKASVYLAQAVSLSTKPLFISHKRWLLPGPTKHSSSTKIMI